MGIAMILPCKMQSVHSFIALRKTSKHETETLRQPQNVAHNMFFSFCYSKIICFVEWIPWYQMRYQMSFPTDSKMAKIHMNTNAHVHNAH